MCRLRSHPQTDQHSGEPGKFPPGQGEHFGQDIGEAGAHLQPGRVSQPEGAPAQRGLREAAADRDLGKRRTSSSSSSSLLMFPTRGVLQLCALFPRAAGEGLPGRQPLRETELGAESRGGRPHAQAEHTEGEGKCLWTNGMFRFTQQGMKLMDTTAFGILH